MNQINLPTGGKTPNKFAYKLTVEDPSRGKKQQYKYFISLMKIDISSVLIEFKGFLVDEAQLNTINTYEDALSIAEKKEIINLMIPWQRVISIENILYKQRFSAKEKNNE